MTLPPFTSQPATDGSLSVYQQKPVKDLRSPSAFRIRRGSGLGWLRVMTLLAVDSLVLWLALSLIKEVRVPPNLADTNLIQGESAVPLISLMVIAMFLTGAYGARGSWKDYTRLFLAITGTSLVLVFVGMLNDPRGSILQPALVELWLLTLLFVTLGRLAVDLVLSSIRSNGLACSPIFIFSHPENKRFIVRSLAQKPCYAILGWNDIRWLDGGNRKKMVDRVCYLGASEVFVCGSLPTKDLMLLYWELRNMGITLHHSLIVPRPPLAISSGDNMSSSQLYSFTLSPPLITGMDFWVKRGLDFCAATVFLILAAPLYLLIGLVIKLDSPGPVFFKQTRIGLRNHPFLVWKFRTMVANASELQGNLEGLNETKDGVLFKIKHDPRITRIGKFLRCYSLDELPQIFNVLLGEMSLVGPRPLPVRDIAKLDEDYLIRHEVLPGITGLWQVSGRSDIDNFEDVFSLDMAYIKDWSLWLDLRIILQTIKAVIRRSGAY
jgi:exopolysaccharide biosynthesis polyprenyl glycosylphosphotransferase